jgi:hypothetical protein
MIAQMPDKHTAQYSTVENKQSPSNSHVEDAIKNGANLYQNCRMNQRNIGDGKETSFDFRKL